MNKVARFPHVQFDAATIRKAIDEMRAIVEEMDSPYPAGDPGASIEVLLTGNDVSRGNESWSFDTLDEYLAELTRALNDPAFESAYLSVTVKHGGLMMDGLGVVLHHRDERCRVEIDSESRAAIERVHGVFADAAPSLRVEEPAVSSVAPRVFIGHGGRSRVWQDLLNHLRDHHHLEVVAYETGSRSGHGIRDVLEAMLDESSFAIMVMTAEDELIDETFQARQNVIHEAGLFQGRLGFPRAIMVREEGVSMPSNLDGIQYISFSSSIRETYGEVLAAIRREFGAF